MKIIFTSILFSIVALLPKADISMLGLKIGDRQKSIKKLKLKVDAQEDNMIKFKTNEGNDLSITCEKGKIVYMENDWLQDTSARKPLFSDFLFGQTTLRDIRKKFDTNGFAYNSQRGFVSNKNLIQFNCFEFDSPNNEILVLITKVLITEDLTEENIADNLKLDAIIIADKSYLDKEWGKQKIYDKNYKKINL